MAPEPVSAHLSAPVSAPITLDTDTLADRLGAGARQLGLSLQPAQRTQLLDYLRLLARWGQVYNLTAVREPAQMLTQHLLDSLAVWPALQRERDSSAGAAASLADGTGRQALRPAARLLDVGSGAGLPGVVLAIVAPDMQVTCLDAVGKKAGFVRQVAAELGLTNLRAVHARVESLPGADETGGFDVITSRAFASLADFVEGSQRQLARGGIWMAMKGQRPDDEITALPASVEVFHVEQLVVPGLQAQRCLVWMRRRR